jgi:hypothetical protein
MMRDSMYWGVFMYGRDVTEPKYHGARGTHQALLEPSGRLRVHGVFTNRDWPAFDVTWTPSAARRGNLPPGWHHDDHFRFPPDETMEHPVWPPDRANADDRVVPATGVTADSLRR